MSPERTKKRNRQDSTGSTYFDLSALERHKPVYRDVEILKDLMQKNPSEGLAAIEKITSRSQIPRGEWFEVLETAATLLGQASDDHAEQLMLRILKEKHHFPYFQQSLVAELAKNYAQNGDSRAEKLLDAATNVETEGPRHALLNVLCREAKQISSPTVKERLDAKLWQLIQRTTEEPLAIILFGDLADKRLAASPFLQGKVRQQLEGQGHDALRTAIIQKLPLIADKSWVKPLLQKMAGAETSRGVKYAATEILAVLGRATRW